MKILAWIAIVVIAWMIVKTFDKAMKLFDKMEGKDD